MVQFTAEEQVEHEKALKRIRRSCKIETIFIIIVAITIAIAFAFGMAFVESKITAFLN